MTRWENVDRLGGGTATGPACPTPPLALWNRHTLHDLPEPDWPDGHRPTVSEHPLAVGMPVIRCSCGRYVGPSDLAWYGTPAHQRRSAASRWESEHVPDRLGDAGRAWVLDARRALFAAHREASS